MKKEPTVKEVAEKFGCTEEQVRAQYARNALQIRKESARIKAGGKNPNNFDPAWLDQRADEYEENAGVDFAVKAYQGIQKLNPFASEPHRAAYDEIRRLVLKYRGTDIGEYQ